MNDMITTSIRISHAFLAEIREERHDSRADSVSAVISEMLQEALAVRREKRAELRK